MHDGKPYIVKFNATGNVKTELDKGSVKGFLQIFETQFPLSKQAREKGRVQSIMKVESTNKIKELMLEFVSSKSVCFQSASGPGQDAATKGPNSDLDCLHTYGFTSSMRFSGTEYMGMSALRYSVKGDREVVIVNAAEMWPILREHHAEEAAKLSAEKNVTSFMGEKLMYAQVEDAWVQALFKEESSAIMWKGIVPEGSLFFVPAGVLLLEPRASTTALAWASAWHWTTRQKCSLNNLDVLLAAHMMYAGANDRLAVRWRDVLSRAKKPAEAAGTVAPPS